MDFSLGDEELALKDSIIEFAQKELNKNIIERDKKCEFFREGWEKCAEFGIHGLPIPHEYGGTGSDIITTILAMEGLGYGCKDNGLIFSINAHMWSCEMPILTFGNEDQKKKYLPKLCSGEYIGIHAMTEPNSGSDAFSLQTTARKVRDKYILNGTKMFITDAPIADLVLVFAKLEQSKGMRAISAFLVEKGTPGFSVSKELDKMGLRTSPMGEVVFDNCEVPEENLLGKEGAGGFIFNSSMEWERSFILASCVGTMERQLETCIKYAMERHQFGRPIGRFQSISNKIAEMKVRIETSKLLIYKIGWLKKIGKRAIMESAIAKLYVSECFIKSSLDAIQIHGGYGYMTEFEVERDLRDSVASTIYSGTSEIQKLIIAEWLGLYKPYFSHPLEDESDN